MTGQRYLGGFVGSDDERCTFVTKKVQQWCNFVQKFADIAVTQPQAAYAALSKSLQSEWTFLLRAVPRCEFLFQDLEHCLESSFLPSLFGLEISKDERELFGLPLRMAGLGVANPMNIAPIVYESSVRSTILLVKSIIGKVPFEFDAHVNAVLSSRTVDHQVKSEFFHQKFDELLPSFDSVRRRAILRAKEFNISSWLSVLPLKSYHFDLSAQEFRDSLALRYRKPLLCIPSTCE